MTQEQDDNEEGGTKRQKLDAESKHLSVKQEQADSDEDQFDESESKAIKKEVLQDVKSEAAL